MPNHHNHDYDGGSPDVPLSVGDRFYGQDRGRDFEFLRDKIGQVVEDLVEDNAIKVSGGRVTQGTGDTLSITPCVGYAKFSVDIPGDFGAANPPSVSTEDVVARVESAQQTDLSIPGATLDGVTTNYVKLQYQETSVYTRSRAKKAGSYVYEVQADFQLVINTTAPGTYDVLLATFVGSAGGTFDIDNVVKSISLPSSGRVAELLVSENVSAGDPIGRLNGKNYIARPFALAEGSPFSWGQAGAAAYQYWGQPWGEPPYGSDVGVGDGAYRTVIFNDESSVGGYMKIVKFDPDTLAFTDELTGWVLIDSNWWGGPWKYIPLGGASGRVFMITYSGAARYRIGEWDGVGGGAGTITWHTAQNQVLATNGNGGGVIVWRGTGRTGTNSDRFFFHKTVSGQPEVAGEIRIGEWNGVSPAGGITWVSASVAHPILNAAGSGTWPVWLGNDTVAIGWGADAGVVSAYLYYLYTVRWTGTGNPTFIQNLTRHQGGYSAADGSNARALIYETSEWKGIENVVLVGEITSATASQGFGGRVVIDAHRVGHNKFSDLEPMWISSRRLGEYRLWSPTWFDNVEMTNDGRHLINAAWSQGQIKDRDTVIFTPMRRGASIFSSFTYERSVARANDLAPGISDIITIHCPDNDLFVSSFIDFTTFDVYQTLLGAPRFQGIALEAATAGNYCRVAQSGLVPFAGAIESEDYYLDRSQGVIHAGVGDTYVGRGAIGGEAILMRHPG